MSKTCRNCGSELFVGQRFCRACGASTDPLSEEQMPTRMMPPPPDEYAQRSGASTAPASRPDTSPVWAGYQPGVPPMPPQVIPPYTPPRSKSRLGWILAFLGMGLFVVIVVGIMLMFRFGRSRMNDFGGGRQQQQANEAALNESTADQVVNTPTETTYVKTYPLDGDARFSLKNISGNITITTWDQPKAEVRVIKRGGDRNAQVFVNNNSGNLSIRTAENRGNQDVRYEVKLPREMSRVELKSVNGSIKLTGMTAEIEAQAVNGTVELADVTGVTKVQTTNGNIKAVLEEASERSMEFINTNGNIDVTIKSDFDADLDAASAHGSVSVDNQLGAGITIERQIVGQRARGRIGNGGRPLKLRTANGSIKLSKQ